MSKKVFKINIKNGCCSGCGEREFVSEPNQYDVLTFFDGQFQVDHTESINDFKIFCRECGVEVSE